jgi:hypothetical protein
MIGFSASVDEQEKGAEQEKGPSRKKGQESFW